MGMFTQNEIMLMIGVVSVLLICITILTIIDIKEYLKATKGYVKEKNIILEKEEEPVQVVEVEDESDSKMVVNDGKVEINDDVYLEEMEEEKYEVKKEDTTIIDEGEEVILPKVEIKEPTIQVEVPKVEVKEEKIEVELPKVEVKETKKTLDAFEELEEIENNLPNKKDDVTNFEAEQERTAIISLDELMQKSNELYMDNEETQYDDGNEPISIDEVIKMFNHDHEEVQTVVEETKELPKVYEEQLEEKIPYSKKETIPFISSVYGIEKDDNALEFENTATYEKLDRQNYNDFVAQLKEMNENK